MFSSTIIPTIARPSLARAVHSVLEQTLDEDFEIIVVNDSGVPLPEADWQHSAIVRVINTNRRERSVARNTGAAIARGKYFHFLDDDDWLLPAALQNLQELAQQDEKAAWLFGSSQLVDRQGNHLIQLHHWLNGNCFVQVMAGEWIPLQASLIDANAFFAVGGFHPRLPATQDVDLCRRIALVGDFCTTPKVVACIGMGQEGSTTDRVRGPLLSRWARERILESPGAFSRMRASARASRWRGRMTRIYLTSLIWNLQHHRLFTALSRAAFGLTSLALAGLSVCSKSYWQSVLSSYQSETFQRGIQAKNQLAADNQGFAESIAE